MSLGICFLSIAKVFKNTKDLFKNKNKAFLENDGSVGNLENSASMDFCEMMTSKCRHD